MLFFQNIYFWITPFRDPMENRAAWKERPFGYSYYLGNISKKPLFWCDPAETNNYRCLNSAAAQPRGDVKRKGGDASSIDFSFSFFSIFFSSFLKTMSMGPTNTNHSPLTKRSSVCGGARMVQSCSASTNTSMDYDLLSAPSRHRQTKKDEVCHGIKWNGEVGRDQNREK